MSLSFLAPVNLLNPLWRTHSCVPRSHSCERCCSVSIKECRDESRHGTQECVRHKGFNTQGDLRGGALGYLRREAERDLDDHVNIHRRSVPRGGLELPRPHVAKHRALQRWGKISEQCTHLQLAVLADDSRQLNA